MTTISMDPLNVLNTYIDVQQIPRTISQMVTSHAAIDIDIESSKEPCCTYLLLYVYKYKKFKWKRNQKPAVLCIKNILRAIYAKNVTIKYN